MIRLTAQSTEELEVIAANELVRDVKWFIGILCDLNSPFAMPKIHCDNDNAITWIQSRRVSDHSKPFEAKLNLIRESYQLKEFEVHRIAGAENPADLMTQQLNMTKMNKHYEAMGMLTSGKWNTNQINNLEEVLDS